MVRRSQQGPRGCPGCGVLTPCPGGSQRGPSVWHAGTARCWRGCSAPRPRRCCQPAGGKGGGMCPGARQDEEEEDRHHGGCICRSGSPRNVPGIILTLIPITQCVGVWAAKEGLPSTAAGGLLLVLVAALVVPGAGGSRGTPAAAAGGGGRCSSAVSGCRWWLSAKRQGRENHHQGCCHSGDTGPKRQGWRAKGCGYTRRRVPVLAQSSGQGPAPAEPAQAPVTPRQAPGDRQLSHPAKAMGKDLSTSHPTFLCVSRNCR